MNYEAVFDTFPWPQTPTVKQIDAVPRRRGVLQNAVDATDHQIDRLVYDLYGLTADEIKLVEDAE